MLVTKNKGLSFRNADFVRSIQLPFEIQDIENCAPTWSFFAFVELFTTRTVKKDQHEKQRIGAARIFLYEIQRCRRNLFKALFESKIFLSLSLSFRIYYKEYVHRIYIFHTLKFLYSVEIFYEILFYSVK